VTLLIGALFALTAAGRADEVVIDDFEYSAAEAARQWRAQEKTPPVSIGGRDIEGQRVALRVECPFTRLMDRAYVDRSARLDLTHAVAVRLDLFVAEPRAVSRVSLYLRSGAGWYRAEYGGLERGWQTLSFPRAAMRSEGQPSGWRNVETVRVAAWRAEAVDTFIGLDRLRAETAPDARFVVVAGSNAVAGGHAEARLVEPAAQDMFDLLAGLGLRPGILDESALASGGLRRARVALLPFNPALSAEDAAVLRRYIAVGGKLFAFYILKPDERVSIEDLVGARKRRWLKRAYDGQFAEMRFSARDILGLPERVFQNSWNINEVEPVGRRARVLATWHDTAGRDTNLPAAVITDAGVYFSHLLLADDIESKRRMMLALLGHFAPEAWPDACQAALDKVARVGPARNLEELRLHIERRGLEATRLQAAIETLDKAAVLRDQASLALLEKSQVRAYELAAEAQKTARRAYRLGFRSRDGEFRGVWNHSGAGPLGDWPKSIEALAAARFNAVLPNLLWAGLAHYDSRALPTSETFRLKGDQAAQCVAAARRHGIEVHPWKVCWNLVVAPATFVDRMKREGRTQLDTAGKPLNWLCPSHPENAALELASILEVVRQYDVDGIHLDYIRYPNANACYCAGCRRRFQDDARVAVKDWPRDAHEGALKEAYRDWRCQQITRFVRSVSTEARRLNPHVRISAAVFPDYPACRQNVGQDWADWARKGYVDFLCPMDYYRDPTEFRRAVMRQAARLGGVAPLYPGIGVTPSYTLTPEETLRQVEIATTAGADGFVLFDFGPQMACEHVPALGETLVESRHSPPHRGPRVEFDLRNVSADPEGALTPKPGEKVQALVRVVHLGVHRRTVAGLEAKIELQDETGALIIEVADCPAVGGAVEVHFDPVRPVQRLAVRGEVRFTDGSGLPFVVRSRPVAQPAAATP
jgi:uncharacterized lipoprotein YddW (UPF0748 family)